MAVALAETLARFGLRISYFPTEVGVTSLKGVSVHHRWDYQILARGGQTFDDWLQTTNPVIWFSVDEESLKKSVKLERKNFLVALPDQLPGELDDLLPLFDRVLCPTRETYDLLRKRMAGQRNLQYLPWDCSLSLASRRGRRAHPKERRLFVHVDSATVEQQGLMIAKIMARLLLADDTARVAVSYTADWNEKARKIFDNLLQRVETRSRFIEMPRTCFLEREDAYDKNDWVWVPAVRDQSCSTILEALSSARPVIAYDCAPASEIVIDRFNGRLIPCRKLRGDIEVDPFQVEAVVQDAVLNDGNLIEIHKHDWPVLEQRRRGFLDTWRALLKKSFTGDEDLSHLSQL